MAKRFDLFKPTKKTDTARCAYIGPDGSCVVLFERHTPLGTQEYVKATTKVANLTVRQEHWPSRPEGCVVHRIVLHESALGLLAIPLATGKPVRIEVWPNNSSENTRTKGFTNQTLVVEVPGLGRFSTNEIPGLIGSGFTLQGPGFGDWIDPQTADRVREWYRNGEWGYNHAPFVAFDDPVAVAALAHADEPREPETAPATGDSSYGLLLDQPEESVTVDAELVHKLVQRGEADRVGRLVRELAHYAVRLPAHVRAVLEGEAS
jgi:hypothetical protein